MFEVFANIRRVIQRRLNPPPPAPAPAYNPEHEPQPLDDVIQRGLAATRLLLGDPTLAEAFAELRAEAYQVFAGSARDELEKREEAYRMLQSLELVRMKLVKYRADARLRELRDGEAA